MTLSRRDLLKPVSGGVLDPAASKGYSQNWSLTLEQQLPKGFVLSFACAGNKGTDILAAMELNPAIGSVPEQPRGHARGREAAALPPAS